MQPVRLWSVFSENVSRNWAASGLQRASAQVMIFVRGSPPPVVPTRLCQKQETPIPRIFPSRKVREERA